ncbi:MAG: GDSL-type esterase/lipase family protein [Crocinitomicaceae bacterium]|nr:GDSL-type esterase/lipase family protein [Crocinitomicaceae bacterium]
MLKKALFILIGLFLISCKKEEPVTPSNSINKILPLGASRVEGSKKDFESFRYELWKDLKNGGWTFDFIGTVRDNAKYDDYLGESFDKDHEGRGGWTSGQIRDELDGWLAQTGAPDIVLFSSPGGNDALEGLPYTDAISNINAIIDKLQASNPNVTIIVEQMAPAHSSAMTPQLTTFMNDLNTDLISIATNQSTAASQVVLVDMYTGFTDDYLADDVHYNAAGASFIADKYYAKLVNYMDQ